MSSKYRQAWIIQTLLMVILLTLVSCGKWGWETIETDNEEMLNVFGLISLDDSLKSFVIVHKTLDTAGPDEVLVGEDTIYYQVSEWYNIDTGLMESDTFWYNPPWVRTVYESRYLVKDAEVIISDGTRDYRFERVDSDVNNDYYWDTNLLNDPAIYRNVDSSFIPQFNTQYNLSITTPAGLELHGEVTTPPRPQIIESILPDTISIKELFQIQWEYAGDYPATITTDKGGWESYICGINQFGIIEPGDTTWNSSIESYCYEDNSDESTTTSMNIRLRFMDENYYKYFLATDNDVESISNFLIGEGGIGLAHGVEGGYGVFGAMSAARLQRIVRP